MKGLRIEIEHITEFSSTYHDTHTTITRTKRTDEITIQGIMILSGVMRLPVDIVIPVEK